MLTCLPHSFHCITSIVYRKRFVKKKIPRKKIKSECHRVCSDKEGGVYREGNLVHL